MSSSLLDQNLETKNSTTSPADELFYKGNLLPLHLPPRLQLVQSLLLQPSAAASVTPVTISPFGSGRVSFEFNPDDCFFDWSNDDSLWDEWLDKATSKLESTKLLRSLRPITLNKQQAPCSSASPLGHAYKVFDEMQQWYRSSVEVSVSDSTFHSWLRNAASVALTKSSSSASIGGPIEETIIRIELGADLTGPRWGNGDSGDSYGFPAWIKSLAAGKSIEFVYIHTAPAADVSVSSYTLV